MQYTQPLFSLQDYYPLVGKIASRYCYDNEIRADLFQSGIIGLINAAERYDNNRNTPFAAYAFPYIKGEILSALAQIKGKKKGFYRSEAKVLLSDSQAAAASLTETSLEELTLIAETAVFSDERAERMFQKAEQRLLISDLLKDLTKEEQKLLYYRYFLNLNQTETGKLLQVSQSEISRREKDILFKLRNNI